jgi:hypothetical protein
MQRSVNGRSDRSLFLTDGSDSAAGSAAEASLTMTEGSSSLPKVYPDPVK